MINSVFYREFSLVELIMVLREVYERIPGDAQVGRSHEGTGNLCIYSDGDYVGVIELHDPPEFVLFNDEESE